MRKGLLFLCAALLVIGFAGMAGATELLVNGDFSSGLTGWTYSGDVDITSDSLSGMDGQYAVLGSDVDKGVASLSQDFTVTAASTKLTISFDCYFYYTDSASLSSDNFLSLVTDNGQTLWGITWGTDTEDLLSLKSDGKGYYYSGTYSGTIDIADCADWLDFGYDAIDYTQTLKFKLDEAYNNKTNSYIGIDNVSIDDGLGVATPTATTPEPATMVLFGVGLLGVAGLKRKFIRK